MTVKKVLKKNVNHLNDYCSVAYIEGCYFVQYSPVHHLARTAMDPLFSLTNRTIVFEVQQICSKI